MAPKGYRIVSGVEAYKKMCLILNVHSGNGWIRGIGLDSHECLYALPDTDSISSSLIASIPLASSVQEVAG